MSTPSTTNPSTPSAADLMKAEGSNEASTADAECQDRIWDFYQNEEVGSFDLSLPRVEFLASRARTLKPGGRVLNIGVGGGTFERAAQTLGLDIHSLDPNEQSIGTLRTALGLSEEKARVGYSQEIPFADDQFDCVVMSEVLEHLPDVVQHATMDELKRVLKPDGFFLGTVPAEEDLGSNRVVCPDCGSRFHRWGHLHSFDQGKLTALLSRAFRVEEITVRSFTQLRGRKGLFGKFKRLVRLSLLRTGLVGAPADTKVFFFQARQA